MNAKKLLLFDMDGVVIDSAAVVEASWRSVCAAAGRPLHAEDLKNFIHGRRGDESLGLLFPEKSESERAALWQALDAREETAAYSEIPGVYAFIAALQRVACPLGLVTSSGPKKIKHALAALGLDAAFTHKISRDDVQQGKPNPEPYLCALQRFGIAAAESVVFEDAVSGVCAARAAGATVVGIGTAPLLAAGAWAQIPDFCGLTLEKEAEVWHLRHPQFPSALKIIASC